MGENQGVVDINNICRSCMGTNENMQNVFEDKEYFKDNKLQLAEMLMACTSVQVTNEDGLPSLMCSSCEGKLITAYDFKQLSEKSDSILRELIKSLPEDNDVKEERIIIQTVSANESNEIEDDFFDNDANDAVEIDDRDYSDSDYEDLNSKRAKRAKNKYECIQCDKVFRTKKGLKIHEKKHNGNNAKAVKRELKESRKTRSSKDSAEEVKDEIKIEEMELEALIKEKVNEESQEVQEQVEMHEEEKEEHQCNICSKILNTATGLKIHMRKHITASVLVCEVCNETFTKPSHFKRHQQQSHGIVEPATPKEKKLLQCEFCDRTFKYRKSFNHHMQSEHGVDGDDSDVCLSSIAEKFKREQEVKGNAGGTVDNADNVENPGESVEICMLENEGDELLFPVPDKKRPPKVHTCHVCQTEFSRANHLTRHMILHRAVLIHKCTQCDNAYATEEHLKKHVEEGHVNKPYACTMCNKQFSRGEHLIRHLKTHQNATEEDLKCTICEKTFTRSDHLARHTKVHLLQDKRHVCSDCGKAFNRLDNLKTHQRIHTGIKDPSKLHLCIYCGKEFNNSSNMIVHMRRHTGERPYKCGQCGKGFPRSHDLKCHERTHSGEKPYLCTLCGKSFNKSNKLLRHTRVHTGERPYVCSICGRAFTQSNDLALHMRRHTGARPYGCGMCPARFIQSGQLKAHRRSTGHWVETPPDLKGGHRVEPVTPILDPVPVRFRTKPKMEDEKPPAQMVHHVQPIPQQEMMNSYQMVSVVPGPPKLIGLGLSAETIAAMAPRADEPTDHNNIPPEMKLKMENTEKENQTMAETSYHHDAFALQKGYFPTYM